MTTHALFDLDGTLTDSAPGILASLRHAFGLSGVDTPAEAVLLQAIGPPFELGLPEIGVPPEHVLAVIGHYRERYEDVGLFENQLYDGVVDMLETLATAGVVLALATAKPEPTARRIVDHFGLTARFAVIAGATHEPGRRTKTEVVAHALAELGVAGGPDVVMVGDRDHDMLAARHHGLGSIGVVWGYGSVDELTVAGANALASTPADVVSLVRGTSSTRSTRMGDAFGARLS
jgi:phosphoglycolate phosphatase